MVELSRKVFSLHLQLLISSSGPSLSDVTTSITCSLPLTTHPSHFHQSTITPTPQSHTVTVVCTPYHIPAKRCLTLTTTYTTSGGEGGREGVRGGVRERGRE